MIKQHDIDIRQIAAADRDEWLRMRLLLWPDSAAEEIDSYLEGGVRDDPTLESVFVAVRSNGALGGFLEVGLRGYAEGCRSSPVAYIEGWYVDEDLRRSGAGSALMAAAEAWARSKGLSEVGSDALITNNVSIAAHKALGFSEIERVVCFAKRLDPA